METAERNSQAIHNGAIWAGILAAGIGCAALGALVDLAETSKAASRVLNFYNPTGDLSGKSTIAVLVWLLAWAVLHARWKKRDIGSPNLILAVTLVLILASMVAVFPPFFEMFAAG